MKHHNVIAAIILDAAAPLKGVHRDLVAYVLEIRRKAPMHSTVLRRRN